MATKKIAYSYPGPDNAYTVNVYTDGTTQVAGSNTTTTTLGNKSQTFVDSLNAKNDIVFGDNSGDVLDGRGASKSGLNSGNDFYIGGNAKDTLYAGDGKDYLDGGNGTDWLYGYSGAGNGEDLLVGGNGGDVLVAGTVKDTFLYRSAGESTYTQGAALATGNISGISPNSWDVIVGFKSGTDKIDLNFLNAELTGVGPNHLIWRGANGTDAAAGTVRPAFAHSVWTDSAGQFLYADINGDGKADLKIQVSGVGSGDLGGVTVNTGPVFTSGTTASEAENTVTSNVVYKAVATDPNGDTVTYSLDGPDKDLFNISVTGEVTFKVSPNFEAPGDSGHNNVYDIIIKASDGFIETPQAVSITVTNVNEAPSITSAATATVDENTTAVMTVTSSDPDAGATAAYSISGGADADLFNIDASTGALSFKAAPNYEAPGDAGGDNVYNVQVQVSDGALTATKDIAVTVGNVNEAPSITSAATATVDENTTAVMTVTSSDPDAGATAAYSISGGADADLFNIDASTGALSFKAAPNYEAPGDAGGDNVYNVQVQVSDGALTATKDIAVTVGNVNEAPSITSAATATVDENTTAVMTVTSSDPDAGATAAYSISGGADADLFNIDASTGALSFKAAPNYEAPGDAGGDNVYNVQVQVSDGALTATKDIAVTVGNVNEAPSITSAATATVDENTTAVMTVTSSDPDAGATAAYSISGGADADLFNIDASTGALSFKAAPNYEAPGDAGGDNVYNVQVQVSDGALTATKDIAVTVGNVNEAPSITSAATATVDENTTAVMTVTSSDPDAGATAAYSISGGADADLFNIDASTGALSFKAAPNYEAPGDAGGDNVYNVQVQVSDGALTATKDIAVTVGNVNEAPSITSAATATVDENTTAVMTVTSSDPDAGATAAYSISGGADADLFNIDASTGALSFKAAPNYEAPGDAGGDNVYNVQVQVSDGALTATKDIAVTVGNVNEAPSITSAATATVDENTTAVMTVTSSDPDAGATAAYSISGGADADLFNIDASTGALSFKAAPNYEAPGDAGGDNVYNVQVQVSDGALTATKDIAVTVGNVNEAPSAPVDTNNAANSVNAHAVNGTVVGLTVQSTDPDAGDTRSYAVTGGTGQNLFSVNAATGVVTVSDSANLAAGSYTLAIDAVDNHNLAGASSTFTINVAQNDLGGPTGINFVLSSTGILAADNSSNGNQLNAGTDIGGFVATGDPDSVDTFHYALGGASAGLFSINSSTGELSVGASNLNSQSGAYALTVMATDQANNSTSTTVNVWVLGTGGDNVTGGSGIDIMFGMNGNDTLDGSSGSDAILGGPNADTLTGGLGADQLVGGAGKDTFVYNLLTDSNAANGIDTIYNFSVSNGGGSQDSINVHPLDANSATVGNQDFTFNTTTATAHGIWYTDNGTTTTVHFDTDGNTSTDEMTIVIVGTGLGLTSGNFTL